MLVWTYENSVEFHINSDVEKEIAGDKTLIQDGVCTSEVKYGFIGY